MLRSWATIDVNFPGEPRKIAHDIGIVTASNRALVGKRSGGNPPTLALLADQILSGNPHIIEEYLVEAHLSVYLDHRTSGDAWRSHVYQYVRQTAAPRRAAIGSAQKEHPINPMRLRSPNLR